MSYNTWPTFAGRGWNIKKRPITKTIIETADGGQEFRLSRFQSPLYEFDIEIPYLSQADYATLQHFFAQQGGPFTPFLFYPDNEAATATPFFTGDGVTTQATLTMPDGSPALFANSGATPNVTAIHQTDWQGRVALSSQPRTNWIPFSAVGNNYPAGVSIATGQPDPAGGTEGITFTATANQSAGQAGMGVYWLAPSGVPTSGACNWSLWIKASRAGIQLQVGTNSSGSIIIVATTGAWQLVAGTGSFVSADAMNVYGSHYATGSQMLVVGDSITMAFGGEYQGAAQPVIPTTSAPVTVTDYTQAGNQITFGQVPAVGAVEDWDGTYEYLVRFKDDQIEMTQTMNQVYEATTITLRSVR